MNSAAIAGRLIEDPEIVVENNNFAHCSFTLAVRRGYKDRNQQEVTDLINCKIKGKPALKKLNGVLTKGRFIAVKGKFQVDKATNRGQNRYYHYVEVDSFTVGNKKR